MDVPRLTLALMAAAGLAAAPGPAAPEDIRFPRNAGVVDVRKAPYSARGDGVTDDTAAIQRALDDHPAMGAIIYLPNGTYLLSDTLRWGSGRHDHTKQRLTILQGQSRKGTVLRLKDRCPGFGDPARPKEMIWTGGRPAQRFRNAVRNVTVHAGEGNPGAIGMRFNASNVGCVRDVTIFAPEGTGKIGFDASFADDYGPYYVKGLTVEGFDTGIAAAHGVNSVTFEYVTLRGQREAGFVNRGQPITLRKFTSENGVSALRNEEWYALVTLLDAELTGTGPGAAALPAVVNGKGGLYVRNLKVRGYACAIQTGPDEALRKIPGPEVKEFRTADLPGGGGPALNLPVKETPEVPWDPPERWANIVDFGGKPDDNQDDSDALQKAIDSGRTTVCMPRGRIVLRKPVVIRGKARRLIGCESFLVMPQALEGASALFTVAEGDSPVVVLERFASWFWDNKSAVTFVDNRSRRTLVLRELGDVENCTDWSKGNVFTGPGEVFLEDVTGRFHFKGQTVWARYLNPETNQDQRQKAPEAQWHLINEGGKVWICGIKTEGPGSVAITRAGGQTELLGGLMYSSGGARTQDHPAFIVEDGRLTVSITEANFSNNAYKCLIRVSKGGRTVFELNRGQTPGSPGGSMIPFWSGP